jgi:hypothetical protein
MRPSVWAAVVIVLAGAPRPAYSQVTLEWKLKEGDTFYVETVAKARNAFEVNGKRIATTETITRLVRMTVRKKTPDAVVVQTLVEAFKVSADAKLDADLERLSERQKGMALTFTLDARGQVKRLAGYEAAIKHLSEDKDEMAKTARRIMPREALIQEADLYFGFLPDKAVARGDRWRQPCVIPVLPLGSFKGERELTYAGMEDGAERIVFKAGLGMVPPREEGGAFKVLKASLKAGGAQGTILFDKARGRLVRQTLSVSARGTLTVDVGGNQVAMPMEHEQTVTTRVLDSSPAGR